MNDASATRPATLLIPRDFGDSRENNFDAIRLAMAFLVIWSHGFALWDNSESSEPLTRFFHGTTTAGGLAVLVFFAISGFLITASFDRSRSWQSFLKRRIYRIHPGYFVCLLVCSIVLVPLFSSRPFLQIGWSEVRGMLSNLLLRCYIIPSDAFGGAGVQNGSLWSIPNEFYCYLAVLICGIVGLFPFRWLFPAAAVVMIVVKAHAATGGTNVGGGIYPCFLLGASVYLFRDSIPRSRVLALLAALILVPVSLVPMPPRVTTILFLLLLPPAVTYLVLFAAYSRSLRAYHAARWGDFSYGVYLYGWPAAQIVRALMPAAFGFAAFQLLSMAVALVAAVGSWHGVEKWFLSRKPKRPLAEAAALVAP